MASKNDLQCQGQRSIEEISPLIDKLVRELTQPDETPEFQVSKTSIMMTVIAGLGFLINILAAIYLTLKMRENKSPFLKLLRALALSDLCVMVTGALLYGMPGISSTYLYEVYPMIAPFLLPIAQTSIMASVYLAALMAFERYIRICFTCHLRSTRLITPSSLKYYVGACVIFPIIFYVPKWFELKYVKDVPRVCYRLKKVSECLTEVTSTTSTEESQLHQINNSIVKLLSIFCWNRQSSVTEKNMDWHLRSTPLRADITYYIVYYMTLNTLFATIIPIGALLFFSISTIRGLHSIRNLFKTSVPLRMSSSRSNRQMVVRNGRGSQETTNPYDYNQDESFLSTNEQQQPSRSRTNVAEPSKEEKRLTRISIIIVIIYILCHIWKLPPSVYEAWYSVTHSTSSDVKWPNWLDVVNDISHVLILANSAFNFIFYLAL